MPLVGILSQPDGGEVNRCSDRSVEEDCQAVTEVQKVLDVLTAKKRPRDALTTRA